MTIWVIAWLGQEYPQTANPGSSRICGWCHREDQVERILKHLLEKDGGRKRLERPLSCSGRVMGKYDDDDHLIYVRSVIQSFTRSARYLYTVVIQSSHKSVSHWFCHPQNFPFALGASWQAGCHGQLGLRLPQGRPPAERWVHGGKGDSMDDIQISMYWCGPSTCMFVSYYIIIFLV